MKKYRVRFTPVGAFGSVSSAPGSSSSVQITTWESGREAHEWGGGGGGLAPSNSPAIAAIFVVRPARSFIALRGILSPQSMEKCGSTSLSAPGRLSQI